MNIGKSIKKIRLSHKPKMNQQKFAEFIGITQSYLSLIENGESKPSTQLLQVISDKHGVPLPVLFWFSIEKSDVSTEKQSAFEIIKPSVDALIAEIF